MLWYRFPLDNIPLRSDLLCSDLLSLYFIITILFQSINQSIDLPVCIVSLSILCLSIYQSYVYQSINLLIVSLWLVTSDRSDARAHTLAHHKQPYAHPLPPLATPQPPPQAQSVSTTESGDVDSIKSDTSSSSSSDSSSDSSSSSEEVPSTLLACVERIKPTALIGNITNHQSPIINH